MNPSLWIAALVAVGLGMILLEVFVPSGGVLGLLAVAALGAGVVTAFYELGALAGLAVLAGLFVAVPIVLVLAFRWFPLTPLGRRVLPPAPEPHDVVPDAAVRQRLRGLVGRFGQTTSELLPWGQVDVDGRRIDAVSEGGPIAENTRIEVVGVQGRAVVVRSGGVPLPGEVPVIEPLPETRQEPAEPRLSPVLESFDFEEMHGKSGGPSLDLPPSPNKA
jgi:membrane-bound serine protease (ClpP class)